MPRYACNTAALSLPHMKLDWTSPLLKHVRATSNPSWIGNVSGTRQRRLPRRHPSSSTGCISRTAETASLKPVYPASLLSLSLSVLCSLLPPARCTLITAASSARGSSCRRAGRPNRPAWHSEVATGPCRWPMPLLVAWPARAVRGRARCPECPGMSLSPRPYWNYGMLEPWHPSCPHVNSGLPR
jgi:hypothetical protein